MEFVVRPYETSDRVGFNLVRSKVYRNGEPIPEDENLVPEDGIGTVVESKGQIVGAATGISFDTEFWGSRIKCIGVAAVGVLPEWRGTGAGAALMRGAHQQYYNSGFEIAALYPFKAAFYRKFGYEYSGYWLKIKANPNQLHVNGNLLPVREIPNSDYDSIRPVYEKHASQMNGMNYRNELQWQRIIGKEKPCTVYVAGDPVEAYLIVRLEGDFWIPQVLKEVAATSKRGYHSILGLLKGLGNNKSELEWLESANSRFLSNQAEQGMQITRNAQVMWRVLNVESVLNMMPNREGSSVSISVADPEISSNEGFWLLNKGGFELASEIASKADVAASIAQFTQIALGQPSFAELADQHMVAIQNPSLVARISEIFPPRTVCHADWY